MLGKPKFKLNDTVCFDIQGETITGNIYIIDPYGTFEDNSDVSYDIMSEEKNCLYKHIQEKLVRKVNFSNRKIN